MVRRIARQTLTVMSLATMLLGSSGSAQEDTPWTDAGTKDGVVLAFRDNRQLGGREVRATKEMPFPAEQIYSVVCDFPRYPEFVPGIREAKTIEGISPTDYVVYLRYSPRFLVVSARDVILDVQGGAEPNGTFRCSWSALEDRLPKNPSTVRMRLDTGSWVAEPLGDARTRVVYQVAVEPGGSIPGWLVRWGAARAMPEIMLAMQKRLAATTVNNSRK